MGQEKAPSRPQRAIPFVDVKTGMLTEFGFHTLDQSWRQGAAGFITVPCTAAGKNLITLTPTLHREGGAVLANHMPFSFLAEQTSDGAVTVKVADQTARKAYVSGGATPAGSGDVVGGSFYVAYFVASLDANAGGFVLVN